MTETDIALVRAHDALAFLGRVKMLGWDGPLDSFTVAVAIAAAEVWASHACE